MTTTADTTQLPVPQTPSPVHPINATDTATPHPIIPATETALRFFRNALYAEKAGLRSAKKAFGISDPERRAAMLWDKAEAAFGKAACMPTVTQSETDLATLCAQVAIYLDDADNADGINPRRFRAKSGYRTQSGEIDEATTLIRAAKGLLTNYDEMLNRTSAPLVALAD